MTFNRRKFLGTAAAGAAVLSAPMVKGAAHGKPQVVVIGGGAGGATAARYIAKDSGGAVEVTLIEPTRTYYTCFFSNLYIGGFRDLASIGHSYGDLAANHGINVVHDWATGVDRDAKTVALAGGDTIPYDRLVISPGIDFVDGAVNGWSVASQNKMPHAYKAGSQTELLKAQLNAMPAGGVYAMVAPPNPFRCPPGPYERISMVAHHLKNNNPTAKIMIFDPKPKFSKMGLFTDGWSRHYDGMIDWIGPDFGGAVDEVRPDSMEVVADGEAVKVDVCNVIPAMKAGRIADLAGLTNDKGWAEVEAHGMTSKVDSNIHVIGDSSQQGAMPKSGFSANSQAKVCANAVLAEVGGGTKFPAKYSNTCWSLIDTDDGIKVGASYDGTDDGIAKTSGFISKNGEDDATRKATYEESVGWYSAMTADMFS